MRDNIVEKYLQLISNDLEYFLTHLIRRLSHNIEAF